MYFWRCDDKFSESSPRDMGARSSNSFSSNFRRRRLKDDTGDEVLTTCQKRVYSLYMHACTIHRFSSHSSLVAPSFPPLTGVDSKKAN